MNAVSDRFALDREARDDARCRPLVVSHRALTERQALTSTISLLSGLASQAGLKVVARKHALQHAQAEEMRCRPFAPGRGPAASARTQLDLALAELADITTKLKAAEATLAGLDMQVAA